MKKIFFGTFAAIALTLCISSCGNNPQEEQAEQTTSETAVETETSESFSLTENTVVSETTAAETSESVTEEYSSAAEIRDGVDEDFYRALLDYPHLTTLVDYICSDLPNYLNDFTLYDIIKIWITDFNGDGKTDAFVFTHQAVGEPYRYDVCMVNDIDDPQFLYKFSVFDKPDFLRDAKTGQLVIKCENHYGRLDVNAVSETSFIFVGDEITETKHVHFTGTSDPEEFYIVDENGEKTVCGEDDITASIAETEKDLQPFKGDTERFRMTVKDDTFEIEKIS